MTVGVFIFYSQNWSRHDRSFPSRPGQPLAIWKQKIQLIIPYTFLIYLYSDISFFKLHIIFISLLLIFKRTLQFCLKQFIHRLFVCNIYVHELESAGVLGNWIFKCFYDCQYHVSFGLKHPLRYTREWVSATILYI